LHVQGTPLKVAQAQLGHSDLATTLEVYTNASVIAQREAVNLLESQLFPSVPKKTVEGAGTEAVASPINLLKWRAQGDDFGTFLAEFVPNVQLFEIPSELSG
jgi:hypothetical protein